MERSSLDQYEEQLYAVFKTFDVDDSEALSRCAVLALCDALQLEERGAALVDTLFERGEQRVTFAQFRGGLLAVLGAAGPPCDGAAPPQPPVPPQAAPPPLAHSDDESSGREVAPKFVFGSKKYGRRSRPCRSSSAPDCSSEPGSSGGRASRGSARDLACDPECDLAPAPLHHDSKVDCESALALCRRLHMDNIDRHLVESIFEANPTSETTVGEFFDRLNNSLTTSMATTSDVPIDVNMDEEDYIPEESVVEAWERAGVEHPRRLLEELGGGGGGVVRGGALQAALECAGAAGAAAALGRLRLGAAAGRARRAAGEAARLRRELAAAERRAQLLAHDMDESQARLEADLADTLRRAEARAADQLRAARADHAAERDRWAGERARLEGEARRRGEAEQRARATAAAEREATERAERRALAAEERAAAADGARAQLAAELSAALSAAPPAAPPPPPPELAALRADNLRLRDRCDELQAALETARTHTVDAQQKTVSWREEAGVEESDSSLLSEQLVAQVGAACAPSDVTECGTQTEPHAEGGPGGGGSGGTGEDADKLNDYVKELESSLELLREEYEHCEEYWSGKLAAERAAAEEEAAAADRRLRELSDRVEEYSRQFGSSRLPAISERRSLEQQYQALEEELAAARDQRDGALAARDGALAARDGALAARDGALAARDQLRRENKDLKKERKLRETREAREPREAREARCVGGACPCCANACVLRVRLSRAERGAALLLARLCAADQLARDLYRDACSLGP